VNIICGVIVSVLSSSVVERAFKPRWDQTWDDICFVLDQHTSFDIYSASSVRHFAPLGHIILIPLLNAACISEKLKIPNYHPLHMHLSCVLPFPWGILTNICRYQIPVITFIFNTLVLFYCGTVFNTLIIHVPTAWWTKKYRNYKLYTKRTFWSNM
jgi:hypothetical protein